MNTAALFAAVLIAAPLSSAWATADQAGEGDRATRAAERFKRADADGNGSLSRAEMEKAAPHMARHFDALDANRDGQVTPAEIDDWRKSRAARAEGTQAERIARARAGFDAHFKKADSDGDGALSKAEADKGMPRLAGKFDRIDADRDGKITRQEVHAWLKARRDARHHKPAGPATPS